MSGDNPTNFILYVAVVALLLAATSFFLSVRRRKLVPVRRKYPTREAVRRSRVAALKSRQDDRITWHGASRH